MCMDRPLLLRGVSCFFFFNLVFLISWTGTLGTLRLCYREGSERRVEVLLSGVLERFLHEMGFIWALQGDL